MFKQKVTQLVTEALAQEPSLFLIDLSIGENNHIKVVLDGDNGVSVKDCIAVSRGVEHNLDREEHDFSLEVTSAGVSEPLTIPRQFVKNTGRKLKVKTKDGQTIEGELTSSNDTSCTLQWKTREPKPIGKGKVTVQKEATLDYSNIVEAKVMINFN
ncbi:MAG: ribosome assembly cofactor RimP [Gilvibacter sp.]